MAGVAISSTGPYTEGEAIALTVTFSEAVTVDVGGGSPQLALMVGTETRAAVYTGGSGTAAQVFSYTVVAGDRDDNGVEVARNALMANDGSIRDVAGNAAVLAHEPIAAAGANRVDTAVPTVSMATINRDVLVLTYSEELDDSSTPAPAAWTLTAGSSPTVVGVTVNGQTVTLRLSAAVLPSDVVTLAYTAGANPVRDLVGNAAVDLRAHPVANSTVATVTGVALTSTAGIDNLYAIGDAIEATVTFSDAVTVDATAGTPQIALTGGHGDARGGLHQRQRHDGTGIQLHGGRWRQR